MGREGCYKQQRSAVLWFESQESEGQALGVLVLLEAESRLMSLPARAGGGQAWPPWPPPLIPALFTARPAPLCDCVFTSSHKDTGNGIQSPPTPKDRVLSGSQL